MAKQQVEKKDKKKRVKVLSWQGILRNDVLSARMIILVGLAVACVTLTFTQLGFVRIVMPDEAVGYAVVLLLPIALAALLLGTIVGTGIGLLSGAALWLHANYMPLDFYELSYVSAANSLFMLTFAGFLLGVLFAFALRNDPPPVRRGVYIALVCIVVSLLFSFSFIVTVIVSVVAEAVSKVDVDALDEEVLSRLRSDAAWTVYRLGQVGVQAWSDAGLMSVVCIVADVVVRKVRARSEIIGLRSKFNLHLAGVVSIAFMLATAVSFVGVTEGERLDAAEDLDQEVSYLCSQIAYADDRLLSALEILEGTSFFSSEDISEEDLKNIGTIVSTDGLMEGYTEESDGLVIIENFGIITITDSEENIQYKYIASVFDPDIVDAIRKSASTNQMQRIVYDGVQLSTMEKIASFDSSEVTKARELISPTTEIAYLLSRNERDYTITLIRPSSMVYANRWGVMAWTTAVAFVLLAVVFIVVSRFLNKTVGQEIDEMNAVLGRIAEGDLDARVQAKDTREFRSLSNGINNTVAALKGWIAEAETRMDEELATAKAIQEASLPQTFPPYPDILKFDIYALMNPAREVGGDFYDFFLLGEDCTNDEGKLGFVVADVSGKGVPAALFMMKAMTLVRDYIESGMELGEAIENANRQLCDGNEAGMFVTLWVGVLDYATGHVDYVNAGHNPPLLWQREGGWRWLKEKSGLPLGLFDGLPYQAYSTECQIGDQFLVYTDGVTEAMDVSGALFGEERLKEVADANYTKHPRMLLEAVRHAVARHAAGAEQSDDITVLALEVGVPPELTATLTVPAKLEELTHVNEFIHTELDRRLCPLRTQNQIDIAVEELFVNVARYAYPDRPSDRPGMARISYTYTADPPSVTIDIADDGIPYNPLAKPDAVTPTDIMEVPIGGLGILMAKRSVNEMRYERRDDSNIVTIVKKW